MAKGAFEHSYELASSGLLKDLNAGVWTVPDSIFERARKMERLHFELINSPAMGAAHDVTKILKRIDEDNKKVLEPLANAMAAMQGGISELARQSEATNQAIRKAFGPSIWDYQKSINELAAPLRSLSRELQQQQEQIAGAVSLLSPDQWGGFLEVGKALQQHFRVLADAGGLSPGSALFEMVRELEAVEPKAEPTREAIERLVNAIVGLLAMLVQNTRKNLGEMGLIEIIIIILALKSALDPDYTSADRRRDNKTAEIVERMEEAAKQAAAVRAAEHSYVDSLPRAVVAGLGRVREAPSGSSRIRTGLMRGAVVAVAEKRGRWCRIIFHDELSGDLAEGWIWSDSLTELQ